MGMRPHSRPTPKRRPWPRRFTPLRVEPLAERPLLSIAAQLVADLNVAPAGLVVSGPIVELQGVAFFAANDGMSGVELWKSDGTKSGTVLVRDVQPGPNSCNLLF